MDKDTTINLNRALNGRIGSQLKLNQRERLILRSVIHHYILTADPVGSRILARRYQLGLSAATIRNTMADLEEVGLLTHPHTSAGRVPTDLGYRVYVDDLMQVEQLSDEICQSLSAHLSSFSPEINRTLNQVNELLSSVSNMLAIITSPELSSGILEKVELVRVSNGRIMVVVVVKSGLVRTIVLEIDSEISDIDIVNASQLINQRLGGLRLSDIHREIDQRLTDDNCNKNAIIRLFVEFPEKIFKMEPIEEMHIGSTRPLLEQPEYNTPDKLKGIIELIEDREIIVHLLKKRIQGVSITIGEENRRDELRNFSVITSTYRLGNESGTLGIIGPTRMNYSRLVSLVDYTARMVSERIADNKPKQKN
ncbi:heat-inducible transcriptional repressor HrcA [bacterium]|nr:heat-inducible transcriptional repressor HrcA [bacterium]